MNTTTILSTFALSLLLAACSTGQDDGETRLMRYYPDGRDIVCLNGNGRYTRALYGTHTRFRLETSDRPLFATYDKTDNRNFRFSLILDGKPTRLDSTDYCEARYQGGMRSYRLRDKSWGRNASLQVTALASFSEEAAIWQFIPEGFSGKVEIQAKMCNAAGTRFNRDGDLGMDPRESFDPSPDEAGLTVLKWDAGKESYCLYRHPGGISSYGEEGREMFDKEEMSRRELVSRIEINTPDPFFNTIGANLVAAADGIWDGETFLHGAIGWRTRLAGWRGAYAGDVMGWNDRAESHFIEYSKSMVTDVPPVYPQPQQDPDCNLARALKKWGTPVYSDGYICRLPGRTDQMSHYDMNLNYIDELMRHFRYDADTSMMRQMWPYIKLHHQWEKRNFDADADHLYDAYCCIWASDALYYSGGAVTHSSAYNYFSNLQTARIAEIIGEDPAPYRREAEAILEAMNSRLWLEDEGHWAEYQDYMGLKRVHKSAAIWSVYTPIDCGAGTPEQSYRATRYVDERIPHIPVRYRYDSKVLKTLGLKLPQPEKDLFTISTTDWLPYVWSTNNVAHEEVAAMALAYLQAGRNDSGFKLLKADLIDEMYLGECPGNFGQISYYDKAKKEAYRDFADNVGVTSRALINGLFGILPDALDGQCIIRQAFPDEWDEASIKTPYLSYSFRREGNFDIYEVEQNFTAPLQIIVRANAGGGKYLEVSGSSDKKQTIRVDRRLLPEAPSYDESALLGPDTDSEEYMEAMGLGDITAQTVSNSVPVDMSAAFNADADDIFRNEYLSPRPPFTTLELPTQGVGEWCVPLETYEIEDNGLRERIRDGIFDTGLGLKFLSPAAGRNTAYTSLWDNYPDSVTVSLSGKASYAWLLMVGSTQNMQSRIENGSVRVKYSDGTESVMYLVNPVNWRPVEQDCYTDRHAFRAAGKNPYRVSFLTGEVMREMKPELLGEGGATADWRPEPGSARKPVTELNPVTDRTIINGGATILKMPLDKDRSIESLTLRTLSNDVVIGLMGVTLEK